VLRSPGLAETLPPSGLACLSRWPVTQKHATEPAAPGASAAEPNTVAMNQLDRLAAIVEREVCKSGPTPAASPAKPVATTPSAPAVNSDEEPLETYLDRFMERLTGKKADAAEPVTQTMPGMPVFPQKLAQPAQPVVQTPPPVREPTRPPECRETMAVMRELANQNARSAVAHHATIDLSSRARLALVAATGSSLISCGLATAALALDSRWCLWGSAALGCLAAIVACRFFVLCRKFERNDGFPSEA
jgi:hypothetical protein